MNNTPADIFEQIAQGLAAMEWLRHEADAESLLVALDIAPTEHERIILCDVLGWRHEPGAVSRLLTLLDDPSADVRSAAADALAKIGDPTAGPPLRRRLQLPEPDPGTGRMILSALGAVGDTAAIPFLIAYLRHPDASHRGSAAWSLGALRAAESLPALENALAAERSLYPAEQMRFAIRQIREATT